MAKLSPEKLAERAQQLADALDELKKARESSAKVRKDWKRKIDKLEERVAMLGEAVRLKQEPAEQMEMLQ